MPDGGVELEAALGELGPAAGAAPAGLDSPLGRRILGHLARGWDPRARSG